MTPFPVNIFPNIDEPKVPHKIPRNPPSCLFISCFIVSLIPSINTPKFSSDFTILIVSSIFSFEMAKVIAFPALYDSSPTLFLWIPPSIAEADTIVANSTSTFLAEGTAAFISGLTNLPKKALSNPPD